MAKLILLLIISIIGFTSLLSNEVKINWLNDYDKALEVCKKENKPLLMVFSGSDWCVSCIKLKKRVLDSKEFVEDLSNKYVFLLVDFPSKKENQLDSKLQEKNEKLAEKYNPKGYFPLIVILDREEKTKGTISGYKDDEPAKIISSIKEITSK